MKSQDKALSLTLFALVVLASIYFYFFVLATPYWSLMDDYSNALIARDPQFSWWNHFKETNQGLMSVGRFKPVTNFMVAVRLAVLPNHPSVYHAYQWVLAVLTHLAFFVVMRKSGFSKFKAVLGVLIAAFAFSAKDMILYSTASETMMMLAFFVSFSLFLADSYLLAFGSFAIALLVKEPAIVFLAPYLICVLFDRQKRTKRSLLFLISIFSAAFADYLIIRGLPKVYTSHYSIANISPTALMLSLVKPVLKNYAPVLLTICLLAIKAFLRCERSLNEVTLRAVAVGLSIAVGYTFIIVPWGMFDTWFYLHIPIAFGWAMILAAIWPENIGNEGMLEPVCISFVALFGIMVAINGSLNYRDFLVESKYVASAVCEMAAKDRAEKFLSNCNEGASSIRNALILEGKCQNIPKIGYVSISDLSGLAKEQMPFVFIYSSKCDYTAEPENVKSSVQFRYWKILKNY